DIPNLQAVAKRVIQNNYTPFLGQGNVAQYIDSGQADADIEDGIGHCYVMCQDKAIFGFAIAHDDLLHLIMVDVPYQHQGYGAKLLAFIEREMFAHHPVIRLQTFEGNVNTARFYKTNGWSIQRVEYIDGMDMNMLHMEKGREF
ncbi:MAG: GNAT family N-acetyltransferase, partial [Oscillospiraceae bacterium]